MGLMALQWRDQMQRRTAAILDYRVRLSTENYQRSGTISGVSAHCLRKRTPGNK
jgi:hypothetical protein